MKIFRKIKKVIKIKDVKIGGNNKILIQSMLNKKSFDIDGNIIQAKELKEVGCDIIRVAIPTPKDSKLIYEIKKNVDIPVVADTHFEVNSVIESVNAGADKIRINPGNTDENILEKISNICMKNKIPIRIGLNSGSININRKYPKYYEKYDLSDLSKASEKMVCEAIYSINFFENLGFKDLVISVKSPCIITSIESYKKISKIFDYPIHVGITESGTLKNGIVKSSIGIGSLLLEGIGDTIRVSLSADPVEEVKVAISILKSLDLYDGPTIISCPTCGRTCFDVIYMANKIEEILQNNKKNIKIAVMGCPVNGPGEARDADIGITGSGNVCIIFKKGIPIKKVKIENILEELMNEIEK